jgi:hypothetical protein
MELEFENSWHKRTKGKSESLPAKGKIGRENRGYRQKKGGSSPCPYCEENGGRKDS